MDQTLPPPENKWHVLLLLALVLLVRLPFLNQAIGGDDVYYLAAAYHGLVDPLHPNHTTYIFDGREVTFQGYPHPPGNAWFLTGLLALFGDVYEIPFHAAYILFSWLAIAGVYFLAHRFTPHPFLASLLFLVVPPFLVNGNLLESDVPLAAFWLAGAAAFVYGVDRKNTPLLLLSAFALAISGLIAMQSVLFTPILLAYLWTRRDRRRVHLLVACTPILALAGWQVFERITSGVFPAAVSAGYLNSYGYERLPMKFRNAAALLVHVCFLLFPILLPFIVKYSWHNRRDRDTQFVLLWTGIFLGGASVLFYSGSARYLLPLAAPLAILGSRAPGRWVRTAFAVQLVISLGLATVNYQHWNAYRQFAADTRAKTAGKRVWVDAEWSLRHYFEAQGALPLRRDQWIPTGDIVVESTLAFPAPFSHGGRTLAPLAEMDIRPTVPLRLIGLESKSGYSTNSFGFLPYDVRGGLIDRVQAVTLRKQEPVTTVLAMNRPETDSQVLYGIYPDEGQPWRWTAKEAAVLLKSTHRHSKVTIKIYISDSAPARAISVAVGDSAPTTQRFGGPGSYQIEKEFDATTVDPVTVRIAVDHTFVPPGDSRQLGVIVNEIALR